MLRPLLRARPIAFKAADDGDASGPFESSPFESGGQLSPAVGGKSFAITISVR